jgi:hypothetical protein
MKAKLLVNQIGVANRLHELFGVTKDQLIEVVFQGASGRAECTPHHPCGMPGIRCWGDATRALRDLFIPLGWSADNTDNIPSVFHRHRKMKIAVANSDSGTGLEIGHPQPIREKGDGAQRAVFANQGLLPQISHLGLNEVASAGDSFWYLCIYCGAKMIRAELLCPTMEDGSFKDFQERICLISENDDNGGFRLRRDIPETPAGDSGFEINVTRKQA